MRSSKQQLKDELEEMYKEMTDPEQKQKRAMIAKREEFIREKIEDYGLDFS